MVVVAVGDRARIEPELEKLKLGAGEVRDFEGNPVSPESSGKPGLPQGQTAR
jgi:hypothetical protein